MIYPVAWERLTILNSANFAADGVLGIGFQSNDWFGSPSIVENLFSQSQITSSVLAFKLVQGSSELNIGGLNTDLYSGTPYYTPITQPGSWQVTFSSFTVGSTTVNGGPAYMRSVRFEPTWLFFLLISLNRGARSSSVLRTL